jgi:hypothetical protein
MFCFRTSRSRRTKEGGTTSKSNNQFPQGPRHLQPGGPEKGSTIFLKNSGSTSGPQVAQCSGTAEDLLPQARGPGPCSSPDRKDVRFEHPFLRTRPLADFEASSNTGKSIFNFEKKDGYFFYLCCRMCFNANTLVVCFPN